MLLFMMSALKKVKTRYNKGKRIRERATPYFFHIRLKREVAPKKRARPTKPNSQEQEKTVNQIIKQKQMEYATKKKKKQGQIHLSNTTPEMT